MRIRKLSCLKFTILTGFAIFILINIKSVGEDEQNLQVRKDIKLSQKMKLLVFERQRRNILKLVKEILPT